MRRPAQQHRTIRHLTGWARPYTGITGLAVFYNGDPAAPPAPVPTPADLAARAGAPQPGQGAPPDPLVDNETGLAMTQARFGKIMAREHNKGRFNAFRELAEAAGVPFDGVLSDPESFDPAAFVKVFKEAKQARQAQLTEEQRRAEELAERERAAEAREAAASEREAAAARRDRDSSIRAALVRLGATGDDLDDAAALLRVADDADETAITTAATALKERRPVLFGGAPAAATLPPAPGGAPAGGPPQRTPAGGKDTVQQKARERAERMGLRKPEAA